MSWSGVSPSGAEVVASIRSCTALAANAGADKLICNGSGVAIGGSPAASGGASPYTYSWSPSTGLSSSTVANPTASPTSTTTYTLTVTDNASATSTDAVVVTVVSKPTASAGSNKTICNGSSTSIGGSPTASGGTSPYTYSWAPSTGLSSTTVANPTASPTSNNTYTVTVTDNNGCTHTSTVTVTVNSKPTVNAGTDKTICLDSTVTLGGSPTATGGTSPYTYTWAPATDLSSSTVANPAATPGITTTFTVTVTDNNGCSNTDAVLVTVNQNTVTLAVNPASPACLLPGQTVTFTASPGTYENYEFYRNGVLQQNGTSNVYTMNNAVTSDEVYAKIRNLSPDTVITPCSALTRGTVASGYPSSSFATTYTLPYTALSGTNRLLIVRVSTISSDPTSVTYNGSALTKYTSASNGTTRASIWYLLNPPAGTAYDVIVTGASGFRPIVGATSYINANQTTPFGTAVSSAFSSSSPSVTVSSVTGGEVIDVIHSQFNYSVGSGQTLQYNQNWFTFYGEGSRKPGASSVTMSWSGPSGSGILIGVGVKPCVPDTVITNPTCKRGKSNVISMTVYSKPIITVSPSSATICKDGSVNLSATGATIYAWSPSTGLNTTNATNVTASPTSTTTYTVTGTGVGGCTNTAIVVITVNPSCSNICESSTGKWKKNGTVTINGLTATISSTKTLHKTFFKVDTTAAFANQSFWSKNLANAFSIAATFTWDTLPVAGGVLDSIKSTNSQIGKETFTLAFSKPVLDPIIHMDRIGGYGTLSSTTKANSVELKLITPGIQLIKLAGTNGFEVDGNKIRRTPYMNTAVNAEATLLANGGTAAGSVKLLGLVSQAQFEWTGVGVIGGGEDQVEFILEYCNDSISACSNVVADAGKNFTICPGSTVQLGGTAQPGYTYSWAPATGLSCSTCSSPQASPTSTTNYTLSVTYGTCPVKTDEVLVTLSDTAHANAGKDVSICSGSSITLGETGIAGYSYTWTPITGLSSSTIANPVATPTVTTNYKLTVTSPNCPIPGYDEVLVTVGTKPIADAGDDKYICPGMTAQIGTATQTNYTYSWTPTTALSCTTCSAPFANPTTTTTYTVVVSDSHCASTSNDVVKVVVSNKPFADAGPDKTICLGESIQIGSDPQTDYVYSWTPADTTLSCGDCANPLADPTVTTNYQLVVSSANCSDVSYDEVLVSIATAPVADAGPDQSVCPTASIQIGTNLNPTYQYTWTPTTGLSCTTCAQPLVTPTAPSTTYTVTVSSSICPDQRMDEVVVSISNTPVADAGNDITICPGSGVELGGTPRTGYTYNWSLPAGLSCTTCPNPDASPTSSTSYTVMVGASNCPDINTDNVIVSVSATPVANAGPDQYVCAGEVRQLGEQPKPGYSYHWTPAAGLSCPNCANPLVSVNATTEYELTVTALNCSISSIDRVKVYVNSGPTAQAGNDKVVCPGGSAILGGPAQAGYSYSWLPATGLSCYNCSNPTVTTNATITYTLTVTSTICPGTGSDEVTVAVSNIVPTVSSNQQICYNNSTLLTATGGIDYTWTPATGLSCTTCPNPTATPLSTTTYSVAIIDVNGCKTDKNVNVVVLPKLNVSAGSDITACLDSVITLNATGASNYIWTPEDGLSCSTCPNPTITVSRATTYIIRGIDGGCTGEDTLNIHLAPEYNIDFNPVQTGCSIAFTASVNGLDSYVWNFGDSTTGTGTSVNHTYTKSGMYEICLIVKGDCNKPVKICKFVEIKSSDCNCVD
jgi:hypothetical protein